MLVAWPQASWLLNLYKRFHRSTGSSYPIIASTSRIIIRSCGTEYSSLEGMTRRCCPKLINACRVPENGPSNPSVRKRPMNSRRLQGIHRLTHWLPVEIQPTDLREQMSQLDADEDPVLKGRAQFFFAFAQCRSESQNTLARRYSASEQFAFELVIDGLCHGQIYVFRQDITNCHRPILQRVFINSSWLFYDFFTPFPIPSDMGAQNEMSLAFEKFLAHLSGDPERSVVVEAPAGLNIAVVFTAVESTLAALKKAGSLADRLGARITIVVPQIVPYPLPLTSPPVLLDFNERRFRVIASESSVETKVRVYLCRDRFETLMKVLSPHSLVVLGGRKRWWPTREKSLARRLRRAGHEVIFTETE